MQQETINDNAINAVKSIFGDDAVIEETDTEVKVIANSADNMKVVHTFRKNNPDSDKNFQRFRSLALDWMAEVAYKKYREMEMCNKTKI